VRDKYVKFETGEFAKFPETMQHKEVASLSRFRPVSAGFVVKDMNGKLHCVGESIGLDLKSLLEDTDQLREWLGV
jgi:hypothetical protein